MPHALLSLLIFNKSDFHFEELRNELQNINLQTETSLARSSSELIHELEQHEFDCLVVFHDNSGIDLSALMQNLPEKNANKPIFFILEKYNRIDALDLIGKGAFNVYAQDELWFCARDIHKLTTLFKKTAIIDKQRDAIRKDQARFNTLINNIPMAVAYIHQGGFINVNPGFISLFKIDSVNDISRSSILDLIAVNDRDRTKNLLSNLENNTSVESQVLSQIRIIDSDNNEHEVDLQCHASNLNGEDCIQLIFQPRETVITSPTIKTHETQHYAYSPEYLIQRLNHSIRSKPVDREIAICIIEAADYARIKKNLGITRTERIMHQVFDLIMSFIDENLLISQTGTDIYYLLITGESKQACVQAIEKIHGAFSNYHFNIDDYRVQMPLNIGLVHLTPNITSPDHALSLADVACTVARNKKDNEIHIYNPEQDRSTVEALDQDWSTRIGDALVNNNFKLVFQPIINLKAAGSSIYEVLLRMKSSSDRDILPSQFLQVAKQSGVDIDIDKWVIQKSISTLKETEQTDTTVFIKLSSNSIRSLEFMNWLEKIPVLDKKLMVLEISEEVAIQNPTETLNLLQARKHAGYKVCIEHFGNRPDTINELLELHADFYKIDGAFISHLAVNRKHQSIIHNIAINTKGYNIKTIACFVQDADSLAILWKEGVDYIQGNYLQEPQINLNYQFQPIM